MATVLIVDDRPANVEYVLALLDNSPHKLLVAASGAEALRITYSDAPDLIITDIMMREVDGFQFVLQLRADHRIVVPRIIFLTATYFEEEARALALACGVSRYFTKPVEPQILLDAINLVLTESPVSQADRQRPHEKLIDGYVRLMSDKMHRQVAALEEINRELDQRVADRTAELESANASLQDELSHRQVAEETLRLANDQLTQLAIRDPLTGLFNRRYLEESLEREIARARRNSKPLGIMMIDIDNFKQINDGYGHAAGDTVLVRVSRCLQSLARSEDILCRYGGEEFLLVMTMASLDTIADRAESVREAVQRLTILHNSDRIGPVTVSIGVAMHPEHGANAASAIHAADTALYHAKVSGRNRTSLASTVRH